MVSASMTYCSQQFNLDYKQSKIKSELLEKIVLGQGMASFEPNVEMRLNDEGQGYSLLIAVPNDNVFLRAITRFFKFAGTPDIVKGPYKLLDCALADYGKRTEWNLLQFLSGRSVVPIKKK